MDSYQIDLASPEGQERLKNLFRYGQVGGCVNSVTHDINNYLGAVLAYADLLSLDSATLSADSQRMLGQIMDAVQRCSGLLSALTSVARKPKADATMVEMASVVSKVVDLRRYDFRVAQIELTTHFDEGLPSLVIDLPRIEIALLCLLTNAFEAAQGTETPRVSVILEASPNNPDNIDIRFQDSAPPIPQELRARLFEPLFTTKSNGHLGLGLAVARDTLRVHGGDVYYEEGRGMIMALPRKTTLAVEF